MSLHARSDLKASLNADIYGARAADIPVAKFRMGQKELRPEVALALVRDELFLDGNARQNLATFCQTWLDPQIHELMDLSIDKNMIDKDEYPATAEIESRCVHILADLWNSPEAANTIGCSTTGSSEACMLGGLALKWHWRERMKAAGKPTDKPNLITGPVQVCWHKFARYFDVELREIPLERGRLGMTPEEVLKRVDENTIGVMPTLRRHLHLPIRAGRRGRRGSGPAGARNAVPTSRCMSMRPRAASSRRSSSPTWSGISACRACARSTRPAINSGWRRWASAGWCGATAATCPRT